MENDSDKKTFIGEEVFLIEHSGEIPEVALHGGLYYLTEDPEGPGLVLDDADILPMKQAAAKRYRAIILRDLDPENREKGVYRGLARCAANWRRLAKFCANEGLDIRAVRSEAAKALKEFVANEAAERERGARVSSINCSPEELAALVLSLGLSMDDLPAGWQDMCPPV